MTPPSEMVERVARAIWDARESSFPARLRVRFEDRLTSEVFDMARAAIEAMREPTEAMMVAGGKVDVGHAWCAAGERIVDDSAGDVYRGMIDAALKDSP